MKFRLKSSHAPTRVAPKLVAYRIRCNRMALTPKLPPGRANRKALAYTAEIQRLRASGYSFEAIRVTLLEAGLAVGLTTIKREAAKKPSIAAAAAQSYVPPPSPQQLPSAPAACSALGMPGEPSAVLGSYVGDSRSGKEIVEAFMQGRITNPLLKGQKNESRSD
jgi:hypothetical protein